MVTEPSLSFLTPQQFPILPWGWTPVSPATLEAIRQCGFNLAGFVSPQDLDQVQQAGLQAIVFDPSIHVTDEAAGWSDESIHEHVQPLVARVKDHPALFGYYLRDEPSAQVFSGLARWSQAFHAANPAALPYINLFPNYATQDQLGSNDYQAYVSAFIEQVSPSFLSYDHYALMDDGSLRDLYFPNLETLRAASIQSNLPFWNIVLSNAHFHYAEPSMAGLLFQAYTTLAYGASGISYFTYFAPDVGNYRLAPIDQTGARTPTWDLLRQVNQQIHRLGSVYLHLKSVNVFHTGEIPAGSLGIERSQHLASLSGGEFAVGEFSAPDGQPHVIVVNKNLRHSAPVTIRFHQPGQILRTSPYTGRTAPVGGEDNWLAPGQGVLLALDQ